MHDKRGVLQSDRVRNDQHPLRLHQKEARSTKTGNIIEGIVGLDLVHDDAKVRAKLGSDGGYPL